MRAGLNPRIAGLRLSMLLHLYRVRLRSHAVQEALAGSGIAVGVALVLGVLVANASLTGSAGELVHSVIGSARLQLAARSQQGFDERLALAGRSLPGVRVAAPVLRENVAIVGPRGRAAAQLFGITPAVARLHAAAVRGIRATGVPGGVLLPARVAAATGVEQGDRITVLAFGSAHAVRVTAVLGEGTAGALGASPIAVTSLPEAQRLTGLPGRITQLYIEPLHGADARVRTELSGLAGPGIDVEPADRELALLEHAARPNNQSTELFAAISVMVGFLLALNAMLLTVPERRRFVADLRMQGYDWRQILVLLSFQAIALGLLASAAGVVLGAVLSHAFLHRVPAYLTTAFPVGSREILRPGTVLVALGCGVLATVLASLSPALDLRPSRPTDAALLDREGGSEVIARHTTVELALLGAASVAVITIVVLLEPGFTIAGGVALALTTLSAIPALFAVLARALRWTGERVRSSALIVVVSELRATTTRAVALAGIAALAVYGSVAIGGARDDLLRGLDANFGEYLQTADIWVTTGGNDLTTNSFAPGGLAATVAAVPGVSSVRTYQGGFLDIGNRRMWVIARPPGDAPQVPASQVLSGNAHRAEGLLRGGGWATVSEGFAGEHRLAVGDAFALPSPSGPTALRVAAITTNLGWAPGAVILGEGEYRRRWQTDDPAALEIRLAHGVPPAAARRAVMRALGGRPGLGVQTFAERQRQYASDSRQGLQALSQIATMLLIAAALAVASALSAAIWQRRARLASLKIQGYGTAQLWRALLLESTVVLGVGCIVGALFGVYGHALASRWLRLSTGFPAPFTVGLPGVFLTLSLLAIIALAVISLPGLAAARSPARTTFQE
ncbi:MAG TPA: FtsX-like permease family protein [Solirubrobacteraceae bacterium]